MNPSFPLPRRIVITGASSGLGAALAYHYAGAGIELCLTGRDGARLREVALGCTARGANVNYICADVRDGETLQQWLLDQDRQAPIDLVIANAGVSGGPRDGLESTTQVKQIYDVNVQGVMNTILPLLPRMQARRHGQVALMSSLAGYAPWPGAPAYAASKAAIKTHGLALRTALWSSNVRVSVICPGFVATPMTAVNPYHMPWLIDTDRAAKIMMDGLARNRAVIAFPLRAALAARFVGALPATLQRWLLARTPAKPVLSAPAQVPVE